MIELKLPVSIEMKLDELHDFTAGKLEAKYLRGAAYNVVVRYTGYAGGADGYIGYHIAIAARMGVHKTKGFVIDHINGDPGDNRRCNLRLLSASDNGKVKKPRLVVPQNYRELWREHYEDGKFYFSRTYVFVLNIKLDDSEKDIAEHYVLRHQRGFKGLPSHVGNVGSNGVQQLSHILLRHRGIDVPKGLTVDHINRDDGDNRFDNLRIVTPAVNAMNRSNSSDKPSQFIGVSWHKNAAKWQTKMNVKDGSGKSKGHYAGVHVHEIDAALAYNAMVISGGFNKPLNIIPGYTDSSGVPLSSGLAAD